LSMPTDAVWRWHFRASCERTKRKYLRTASAFRRRITHDANPRSTAHVGVLQPCCASEHSSGHRPRAAFRPLIKAPREKRATTSLRRPFRRTGRAHPVEFRARKPAAFRAVGGGDRRAFGVKSNHRLDVSVISPPRATAPRQPASGLSPCALNRSRPAD
jgi:hypothetical protein